MQSTWTNLIHSFKTHCFNCVKQSCRLRVIFYLREFCSLNTNSIKFLMSQSNRCHKNVWIYYYYYYYYKDAVLFTDLNSWLKHSIQHQFKQILSINNNSWKNKIDSEIYDKKTNENMIEKFVNFHDDDSNVYDLSYVVNWTIVLDDRKILHNSDTRVFNHASEFDFELWCNDQSCLIFDWCINWNYMHFSLYNQTIVHCFD